MLTTRNPLALLILAHYAVVIHARPNSWWFTRWPETMLHRLAVLLGPDWLPWLRWPIRGSSDRLKRMQCRDTHPLCPQAELLHIESRQHVSMLTSRSSMPKWHMSFFHFHTRTLFRPLEGEMVSQRGRGRAALQERSGVSDN